MGSKNKKNFKGKYSKKPLPKKRKVSSLLDEMITGREYASIIDLDPAGLNIRDELVRGIRAIREIRNNPIICYFANVGNTQLNISVAIDYMDDLPFSEMIDNINIDEKKVDIIIVTPGGSGEQVSKFVTKLRPRFNDVTFILPDIAMSAGTIFALSGNEIIMDSRAMIGPIDPQIPNREGRFVPAQALLTIINDIQRRGEENLQKGQEPPWTDIQILNHIDAKEIGNAINSSRFAIELAQEYLFNYKFKDWTQHKNGQPVTDEEKMHRAMDIAAQLCDHTLWKTHSRGITREIAWEVCKIKITYPEETPGLQEAIRKLWALVYWTFENSNLAKLVLSENYALFRSDRTNN